LANTRFNHFLVLVFLAITWGSSFILMKKGLFDPNGNPIFTPNQVAAMRLSFAGAALLPISIRVIGKMTKEDLGWIFLVGCFGSGIPAFLFTNSQKFLDSSLAGILNALTPLFTLVIGVLIFFRKVRKIQILGVIMGFIGAAGLISLHGFSGNNKWSYGLLIVLATFFYGLSVNIVQSKLQHIKALQITALAQLIVAVPAICYVWYSGAPQVINDHQFGLRAFGYVAILGLAGTAVANVLYFWLTLKTSALFASSVTYIMPIVAVFWGLQDHEELNWIHGLYAFIILMGVWLVNKKRP
jgi:drug/metabolite transporter (DMT)-like permease